MPQDLKNFWNIVQFIIKTMAQLQTHKGMSDQLNQQAGQGEN